MKQQLPKPTLDQAILRVKPKFERRRMIGALVIIAVTYLLLTFVLHSLNDFFNSHSLVFQNAVDIKFNAPVKVVPRKPKIIEKKVIIHDQQTHSLIQPVYAEAYTPPAQPTAVPVQVDYYKSYIYQHESGNNSFAINQSSGACGLGQALPCSKLPCSLSDYNCQDTFFTNYMLNRYGSWQSAYYFWLNHGWW